MNLDHNSGHWTQKISSFPFIYSFHWLIIVRYKHFLFKNLLWASSKASEACKERAWQPEREQLVFTCLQDQSSGNTYFGGLPNNHLSFSFALCPGLHILTHTGFFMYFDFPCCPAMVLCTFPPDSSWTIALCWRSDAGPVCYLAIVGDALGLTFPGWYGKIKKLLTLCDHSGFDAPPPERRLLCQHPQHKLNTRGAVSGAWKTA